MQRFRLASGARLGRLARAIRRGGLAGLVALVFGCAQATVPATDLAPLTFLLVFDENEALIVGQVLTPRGLLTRAPGTPFEERLAPAVRVELFDVDGRLVEERGAVTTDDGGRFVVRSAGVGVPGFVRAVTVGEDGEPVALWAFVRADGARACVEVSVVSTLVAARVAADPNGPLLVLPERLAPLIDEVREALRDRPAAGEEVLDLLRRGSSGPAALAEALDAAPGLRGLWDAPTVRAAIDQTMMAFLDVTFKVLGLGTNAAQFPNRLAVDRVLVGTVEFTCETPPERFARVSFWAGHLRLADGTYQDGRWRARVDMSIVPEGPHLLGVVGELPSGGPRVTARYYGVVRGMVEASACVEE